MVNYSEMNNMSANEEGNALARRYAKTWKKKLSKRSKKNWKAKKMLELEGLFIMLSFYLELFCSYETWP